MGAYEDGVTVLATPATADGQRHGIAVNLMLRKRDDSVTLLMDRTRAEDVVSQIQTVLRVLDDMKSAPALATTGARA